MTMLGILAILLAAQEGTGLKVANGWTVERVAGAPLVERPVLASFDDAGRLYVIDSAGVNLKGSDLLKDPPHRIRRLEDRDGDGRFDHSVVFADRLVFPQGILWHDGALYVTSPPGFWKLEDLDGDGTCDRRTELLTGFANTGVADDAHGACLGPDGRIYFLPGRMAHDLRTPDGARLRKATGPWLMRMKPDGTEIEFVCGAQGNPVEVDWRPEGDFFISGTFWAPDSFGGGLRDALVHGIEGGEWPVRDRVYNDRVRTGDLLPVLVPMIATAPSGMTLVRGDGPLQGDLLCTYFNTHRVQRHVLSRDGATWTAKTEDLLWSADADVHPTDVLEDADGSLLVVDTGGWFRIGCPTSQVAKPQVLGAIYRLRRTDAPPVQDPRGRSIGASELAGRLDDPRWAVRERAIHEAGKRGIDWDAALSVPSPRARLNAVWAACRNASAPALAAIVRAIDDPDPGVRQAAAMAAGLLRHRDAAPALQRRVTRDAPQVRREAATALGRIGTGTDSILDSLRIGADRYLEHALILALVRIGPLAPVVDALQDASPAVRKAALIALDQVRPSPLQAAQVTPLLDPSAPEVQKAAIQVISTRPEWAGEIRGLCKTWLSGPSLDGDRAEVLKGVLASFAQDPGFQELAARALRDPSTSPEVRLLVLEAMARAGLDRIPSTWLAEARWTLDHSDARLRRQAVALIRKSGGAEFDPVLLGLARDEGQPAELRMDAVSAAASRIPRLDGPLFAFLRLQLDASLPPLHRMSAAEALGRSPLDDAQLEKLAGDLRSAGPLELPRLLPAFERAKGSAPVKKMLASLAESPGVSSAPPDLVRRILRPHASLAGEAASLLQKLEPDAGAMAKRLAELAPVLGPGDAAKGKEVFLGRKAGCTACHQVAGQGSKVGPDLSKIGAIRSKRDLLEAIVFPSATFARGFEPLLIRTKEGTVLDGILARETPDLIVLFQADRTERKVPKSSIEEMRESRTSVMPQGLEVQIASDELRDLLEYLAGLK